MLLAFAPEVRSQFRESPQEIKAGYVYNFAKLVEWPAGVVLTGQPLVIGVLGDDEFARVLSQVVEHKKIEDRGVIVKRVTSEDLRECGCRVLFVAAAPSDGEAADIVQLQNSASVLTIADASDFARRGGIVGLTLQGSRVHLVVNVDAAARASLTISSRLLSLATIVHTPR